ncbi:hypothetical protein BBK82_45505 [Lentzea guizhouensis]|uniref:Tachylectin 2 domain-containing protein n=1 Tax=Lentzea guizhouensis TaxID=1586287 RepID=A0A1B2HWL2_9PSEU|nr:N,N-dimethylformamidase beta subunit family domain-containing protein [Lentzea guizhouensis]ANZ42120.1 hypothetical protein BBK82_45505 [Lentzea guizhouensis]
MDLGDSENSGVARRTVLQGAAALAGAALVAGPGTARAADDDPEQRLLQIVPGGNGVLYAWYADGRLKWFKHLGRTDGTYNWADGNGREIGLGWQIHTTVLASQDGQVFGFCGDGTLWWHKWVLTNSATGEGYWAPGTNNIIHRGFRDYAAVFGGWDGVFYAVDKQGDLYWFKYKAGDGSNGPGAWAHDGVGQKIASGKRDYDLWWADTDGVIYAVRHGASLHWFRYLAGDGSTGPGAWANDGEGIGIGSGWDWGSSVERFADAGGVFYCVFVNRDPDRPDHELHWYRLTNHRTVDVDGGGTWAAGGTGKLVGTGFTVTRAANLQGYTRWSASQGERLDVAVSTTLDEYRASVLRLNGPVEQGYAAEVWAPRTFRGRRQLLRSGYRANGCGWTTDLSVDIGDWPSGFHVVKLEGAYGMRQYIPFVVKPKQPEHDVALLLPFLTHNAYNHWGGHFQYTWDERPARRKITTNRPFGNAFIEGPGFIDVRFHGDLLLMKWFADNSLGYDCYQDVDLHDPSWLAQYKVLVLASHPEYWTPQMRDAVETYLANGGRVIYTGGNGMYERVDHDPAGFVLHRNDSGHRWLWRDQGRPESAVLGVAYDSWSYMEMKPYVVSAEHPFLEGTGLTVGSEFGHTGYNFAASGWEVDNRAGAGRVEPDAVAFAHGLQDPGHGAEMVVLPKPNGGWVFSVGSLCFNGALADDPAMARILRNAVEAAVR